MNNGKQRIVISIGGSLVHPQDGLSFTFLKHLNKFVRQELAKNPNLQFFLIVGGGNIAKKYGKAGGEIVGHSITYEDLDWLGINATKLNAHLIRTIFHDIAHPHVLKNYEIIRKVDEPVVVAAGWKPGLSTDFCAAMVCEDYHVDTIINLTGVDFVYTKNPLKFKEAEKIPNITWGKFRKLVGDDLLPDTRAPFDPVATKKAQELHLKVVVMKGNNFRNLSNYFRGKPFLGTVIEN